MRIQLNTALDSKCAIRCRIRACALSDPNVRAQNNDPFSDGGSQKNVQHQRPAAEMLLPEAAEAVLLALPAKPNSSRQDRCEKAQLQTKETLYGKPSDELRLSPKPAKAGLGEINLLYRKFQITQVIVSFSVD